MEKTDVIIVGAGPAGLSLGLSLARFNIHSVILEKDLEITQDPRGVYLTNDAIRILWDLGLGDSMQEIGHELSTVNFHTTSFVNEPFHKIDIGYDGFWQVLPNAILHIQPRLESALRRKVIESPFCDLRCGCIVVGKQQSGDYPVVEYQDERGATRTIIGSFLIGADGKKGVVRKNFLEESAGIKQIDSTYRYDGTWIAANFKLTPPTPQTHPEFPLWKLGFTPEAVYDLFWPKGWHFCSPPGKATASGRFGPHDARMWRHELEQGDWNDSMDAEALLWEHITPMITRRRDSSGEPFPFGEVTYPRDCIRILRCRPYRFTHKVVNKWYDGRTILIGDAAHVFPPFGGQGIACGFRDAHQLAWRISLLQRMPGSDDHLRERLLGGWARERHHGIKDAATFTSMNGRLCNQGDDWFFWLFRMFMRLLKYLSFIPGMPNPVVPFEVKGFRSVKDGFFLPDFNGGGRLAQVYFESKNQSPILSDELIKRTRSALTLLVLARDDRKKLVAEAQVALRAVGLDQSILSDDSIRVLTLNDPPEANDNEDDVYFPASTKSLTDLGVAIKPGYCGSNYFRRFEPTTTFVLVRSDFYTFALADDTEGLVKCLEELKIQL